MEKQDLKLSIASTVFFIGSILNATIKTVSVVPESLWGIISAAIGAAMLLYYISCGKILLQRNRRLVAVSYLLFFFIYSFSAVLCILRGESIEVMIKHSAFLTFAWWLPTGLFVCSVQHKKTLYDTWLKASYIITALCFIQLFFHKPTGNMSGLAEYNMMFGSSIILPMLFHCNEFAKNKRPLFFILVLCEFYGVIVYANRGVILSLIFFIAYKFAFESNSIIRKVISIIVLIISTIIMMSSIQSIATTLIDMGVESRTLLMLAEGVIDDTSGRDEIWEQSIQMIEERPIFGWGLGGEYYRLAMLENGAIPTEDLHTFTPHNGVLQNFVNFGIVFGLIINIIIFIPVFRMKKYRDSFLNDLILIFFSSAVVPCMVSASGLFIKPAVAAFLYLYYHIKQNKYSAVIIGDLSNDGVNR